MPLLSPERLNAFALRVSDLLCETDAMVDFLDALGVDHAHRDGVFSCEGSIGKFTVHIDGALTGTLPAYWRGGAHPSLVLLVSKFLRLPLPRAEQWIARHLGYESADAILALPEPTPRGHAVVVASIDRAAQLLHRRVPAAIMVAPVDPGRFLKYSHINIDRDLKEVLSPAIASNAALVAAQEEGRHVPKLAWTPPMTDRDVRYEEFSADGSLVVCEDGTVLRRSSSFVWSIVRPATARDGHTYVTVHIEGNCLRFRVDKLVLTTFGELPAADDMVIAHADGDMGNAHISNLSWATRPPRSRPDNQGSKHGKAKLNEALVIEIRRQAAEGVPQCVLVERYGVSDTTISKVVNRQSWKHVVVPEGVAA